MEWCNDSADWLWRQVMLLSALFLPSPGNLDVSFSCVKVYYPKTVKYFFFFGIVALGNVLLMLWLESCSSVDTVGSLDLTSLMLGSNLGMICWPFVTAFVDNLFTKILGGGLASSVIILRW